MMKIYLLFLAIFFCSACSDSRYDKSDHYNGSVFNNLTPIGDKSLWDVILWKIRTTKQKWPKWVDNKGFVFNPNKDIEIPVITWINHATFLIEYQGLSILTDPVYSKRVSPFSFVGPTRVRRPGLAFNNLPKIDLIMISHNHYDHLDIETLKRISKRDKPFIMVPLGDQKLLADQGIEDVKEYDWYQTYKLGSITATFLPSQHWSARGVFDKRKSLWGSYMISSPTKNIYFGGDTGYGKHFKIIGEKFPNIDMALLPIGAYEPRWFMRKHHMNPDDAVMAHTDLGTRKSIGMHFGTFQLTNEGINDPVKDLGIALKKYKVPRSDFKTLEVGASLRMSP